MIRLIIGCLLIASPFIASFIMMWQTMGLATTIKYMWQ